MPFPRSPSYQRSAAWLRACALALAFALAQAPVTQIIAKPSAAAPAPAWPPPPADPCVVYVKSIAGPDDLGIKPPVLSRVVGWLTGSTHGSSRLDKPFGLALDEADNLLLTDTGANAVCCLDRQGKKWLRWELVGKHRSLSPVAVARHRDTVFVADSALGKVLAFNLAGKPLFEISRELERPSGLAISEDRLFVADSQRHQVAVYNLRGDFVSRFGRQGGAPGS